MYKICVFAGTTEGRELVDFLVAQQVAVTACVATEYGEVRLRPAKNLKISARRLKQTEMAAMFADSHFDMVVDATHPYATEVTANISKACADTGTEYLRLLRESNAVPGDAVFVANIVEAVMFLNGTEGNILLTTGSKQLPLYAGIRGFAQRVYARVLPLDSSLQACKAVRLASDHIMAMQGPFSREMNTAMLRAASAKYLVTKEAGSAGGFADKIAAARDAGAVLVVVGRPPQRAGMTFAEALALICDRFALSPVPRVRVVGIGPGSRAAMTEEVRTALAEADCIIGAKRMLETAAKPRQKVFEAIAPEDIAEYIRTHRQYSRFAVAMSGDVGFFSGARKVLPLLEGCRVRVLPGVSSLAYLCSRLAVSYEDVAVVSVHGRDYNIVPDVQRHRRVFALVGGADGIARLCRDLVEGGLGDVRVSVGERLSYADEKITQATAAELADASLAPLSAALIENDAAAAVFPCGLPDGVFCRSADDEAVVPMTKSEVRAVCLSKLRLTEQSVCWDIGAGTGSVSVEMALQAHRGQVYAIERKENAVELLRENKRKFMVNNLTVVPGVAPEICLDLPAPTHAFIGGSSGNIRQIVELLLAKNPQIRIVAAAITLESVYQLTACLKEFDFRDTELVSLNVARSRAAGSYHLMNGQNPVCIFVMQAGESAQAGE